MRHEWSALLLAGIVAGCGLLPAAAAPGSAKSTERIWYVTYPPYPEAARAEQEQGRGVVRVTTDAQGKVVSAVMETSTGSSLLDSNTVKYALRWHGPPRSTKAIPVGYSLVSHSPEHLTFAEKIGWFTPMPPYPSAMRARHLQGSGVVRVKTDATGKVLEAVMVQSTHVVTLDDSTVNYVRANWHGPPDAKVLVPITYQLR